MVQKKQRQSEKMSGKPKSEEHKQKLRKPILQYTKEGVFIREWDSGKTASEELNLSQGNITECCQNKRKTSGNFIWRYK